MKLDDINKKNIHKVPDGYFDDLPMQIQAKISSSGKSSVPVWQLGLRYALPVVLLLVVAGYFLLQDATLSSEEILAEVETEDLIAYLDETDLSTDELIYTLSSEDFDGELEFETELMEKVEIDELDQLLEDEFLLEEDFNDFIDEENEEF